MYKPPKLVTHPPPPLPNILYLDIALKRKVEQSYNGTVTYKFLYLPKNYYVCQMIAVRKCYTLLLFA